MKLPRELSTEECARLKAGQRVVKVALVSENYSNLKPGEQIKSVQCDFPLVLRAYREYDTYHHLVLNEGLKAVNPEAKTIAEATRLLRGGKAEKETGVKSIAAFVIERA